MIDKDNRIQLCGAISTGGITKRDSIRFFKEAQTHLEKLGWRVGNPWEQCHHLDPKSKWFYAECMKICFSEIQSSDRVLMLGDWFESSGASSERAFAKVMGVPISYQYPRPDKE